LEIAFPSSGVHEMLNRAPHRHEQGYSQQVVGFIRFKTLKPFEDLEIDPDEIEIGEQGGA